MSPSLASACRAAALLSLAMSASSAAAQGAGKLALSGRIAIEGKSNLHDWTCATEKFEATVESPGPAADVGKALTSLTVTVPVKSIDCGHGGMNDNLRKAMHADQHPTVEYRMTSYTAERHGDGYAATVQGVLTINGVERPTELKATVTPNDSGGAGAVGSAPITTTDFGVKPVSAMLGTMRTSPKVTITFRLTAKPE